MTQLKERTVVVFGPSYSLAFDDYRYVRLLYLGYDLAKSGFDLVTGGAAGLLKVVCEGYYNYAGKKSQAYFLDCVKIDSCNQKVAEHAIVPGGLEPRFRALLDAGSSFVCLPPQASLGTLHEFATTLAMIKLGSKNGAPFILYNCLDDFRPIAKYLLTEADYNRIIWADHEDQVIEHLESHVTIKA